MKSPPYFTTSETLPLSWPFISRRFPVTPNHSGSTDAYTVLYDSFKATNIYPYLILSGHVHNHQRFTHVVQGWAAPLQIGCIVAGAGGYSKSNGSVRARS
jgi:hypothetical protein